MAENTYISLQFENNLNDDTGNFTPVGVGTIKYSTTAHDGSYSFSSLVEDAGTQVRISTAYRRYVEKIEFWFYQDNTKSDTADGHMLFLNAWGNVDFVMQAVSPYGVRIIVNRYGYTGYAPVTRGGWSKITITFDYMNGYTKVYIDDVLKITAPTTPSNPTYVIYLGGDGTNSGANVAGYIDNFKVYYYTTDTVSYKGIHRTNKLKRG